MCSAGPRAAALAVRILSLLSFCDAALVTLGGGRTLLLVAWPSQRREMAQNAVARRGARIALACRAFGVGETCYRYRPKLKAENEEIADLLVGLTDARKTWCFGLCFLHPRNVQGHPCEIHPS